MKRRQHWSLLMFIKMIDYFMSSPRTQVKKIFFYCSTYLSYYYICITLIFEILVTIFQNRRTRRDQLGVCQASRRQRVCCLQHSCRYTRRVLLSLFVFWACLTSALVCDLLLDFFVSLFCLHFMLYILCRALWMNNWLKLLVKENVMKFGDW